MIDYSKIQPIVELYTCIQMEGKYAGIPHILVRTTGCTHRCYFGEGGWCDSWYTSIHPEKPVYNLNNVIDMIVSNRHIQYIMITGGSPTMHPALLNDLLYISITYGMKITVETEGSHEYKHPQGFRVDLISLSPKFNNSVPKIGELTPLGKQVTQKMIEQHNKFRMNIDVMRSLVKEHSDVQLKPVVNKGDDWIWDEIEELRVKLNLSKDDVYVMPGGSTLKELQPNYSYVIEECIKRGYRFTGRAQIVAYGNKRGV